MEQFPVTKILGTLENAQNNGHQALCFFDKPPVKKWKTHHV
jgi:hypothetical protein